jgi:serine/threonine protein phosphatase PrpC
MVMPDASCHWVNAGDSRIYHFNQGRLLRRTLDHSYVQTLVDKGYLTPEQANSHPQSNVLVGCLGTEADPPATAALIPALAAGDALVACSDGVWHYLTDDEMGHIVDQLPAKESCQTLISIARERARGYGDNLSVLVVKFEIKS